MVDKMVPAARPQQTREETAAILVAHGVTDGFGLLGVRGYYLKTMGDATKNDRGIYDDAIFILTPTAFQAFNANVDPSITRPGIATLKPGKYLYKLGIHGLSRPKDKQYRALVQASEVVVWRDGKAEDHGWIGLNIHKGSRNSTSSEGCQTIVPDQWEGFIALVAAELDRHNRTAIPYVLIANPAA